MYGISRVVLLVSVLGLVLGLPASSHATTLRVRIVDSATKELIPARVHLLDAASRSMKPSNDIPYWRNHASCLGLAEYELSAGSYTVEVERGPEWSAFTKTLEVRSDQPSIELSVSLERLEDLASEGWWSGEMHVHRPVHEVETLMRADDLHFAQVISWWNKNNPWIDNPLPQPATRRFDRNRFAHLLSGEDERDGGALLFSQLERPLEITHGTKHFPSSLVFAREAKAGGAWIDIEKPFWWDVPMWIAHGIGDSIGIANNHMYRRGVLGNEAWGRARDRAVFPGPRGNGLWTQQIYYHLLNCGIRIPPSAGSASGVLPNPVGYNRAYVHIDGEPTMQKWLDGLRAGRVFVTNGPLLRVTANGKLPGHVFRSKEKSILLTLNARVGGNAAVDRLEIVQDGIVKPFPFPEHLTIQRSGWFLIRAMTDRKDGLSFASTGPFYVELGDKRTGSSQRDSAKFFVTWCRERLSTLEANTSLTAEQKEAVLQPWMQALGFWKRKEAEAPPLVEVRGAVRDADTGAAIASRVYVKSSAGEWKFVATSTSEGAAVRYEKRNWINARSEEFHTTISAHPFVTRLEPGRYEIIVERGKEYFPATRSITVGDEPIDLTIPLKRWVDASARGWYSGDTHVHRELRDLPSVMLAEDLNVAFPLTYWVTQASTAPTSGDHTTSGSIPDELIEVDDTHVIWPRNTEWEIFSVGKKRHTLGAVFALGHRDPFQLGIPSLSAVADEARRQGALLDLDKHDWPWSMTLPTNMGVQLYELANNHIWRTEFAFTRWNSPTPAYMRPPLKEQSGSERDWILFTMSNYYALLNCGVKMVPSGGTASGVHPVPLGFGRVYVQLEDGFDFARWKTGLKKGRSFVTTGPMIFAAMDGELPGADFRPSKSSSTASIDVEILSEQALTSTELIQNGRVVRTLDAKRAGVKIDRSESGAFRMRVKIDVDINSSSWFALRCWEGRPGVRVRYAHTAPWHVHVPGKPLVPRRGERDYLAQRVRSEIERSRGVLPADAIKEYQRALEYYTSLTVRED